MGDSLSIAPVVGWRIAAAVLLVLCSLPAAPVWSAIFCVAAILCAGYDIYAATARALFCERRVGPGLLTCVTGLMALRTGAYTAGAVIVLVFRLCFFLRDRATSFVHVRVNERLREDAPGYSEVFFQNGDRSPAEEWLTHFSPIYTLSLLVVAVLMMVFLPFMPGISLSDAVRKALVLLLIASPCCAVLSVPMTGICAIGGGTYLGVLFRSSRALYGAGSPGLVLLDKEGVLCRSELRLVSCECRNMQEVQFLRAAAHACAFSDLPFAEGIKEAYGDTIYLELVQNFTQSTCRGVSAVVENVPVLLGYADFLAEQGVVLPEDMDEMTVWLVLDGICAGKLLFANCPVKDGVETVRILREFCSVSMLTRESLRSAKNFAAHIGIDEFYAGCTPDEKTGVVLELRNRLPRKKNLIYVGSGLSGPDALSSADVSMVFCGAEQNSPCGDVLLTNRTVMQIAEAVDLGRLAESVLRQNLFFIFGLKAISLLAEFLFVSPLWFVVASHGAVLLLTVINALRILGYRGRNCPE